MLGCDSGRSGRGGTGSNSVGARFGCGSLGFGDSSCRRRCCSRGPGFSADGGFGLGRRFGIGCDLGVSSCLGIDGSLGVERSLRLGRSDGVCRNLGIKCSASCRRRVRRFVSRYLRQGEHGYAKQAGAGEEMKWVDLAFSFFHNQLKRTSLFQEFSLYAAGQVVGDNLRALHA